MTAIETHGGREIRPTADGRYEVQPRGDNYWITVDTVEEAHAAAAPPAPEDLGGQIALALEDIDRARESMRENPQHADYMLRRAAALLAQMRLSLDQ